MPLLVDERLRSRLTLFHDELVERGIDGKGIIAGKTGEAKFVYRSPGRAHHPFDVEITETIDAEIFPDFFHRHLVRDQLLRIGKIDSVMAGEAVWRTAHPHVHFLGAGLAQVYHSGARGCAAHNRIVDHHHAFPRHHFLNQIQFHPHVEIADELTRLQERSTDIVIPNERVFEWNLHFLGEAERRVVSGIRHRNNDVGLHWKLPGKFAPHFGADFADIHATDDAVRPREVNVLKHAEGGLLRLKRKFRTHSVLVDNQNLTRLDFANELSVN